MVIYDRKTLSKRDENEKFLISSPDLSKTGIKVKQSLSKCFTLNNIIKQHTTLLGKIRPYNLRP